MAAPFLDVRLVGFDDFARRIRRLDDNLQVRVMRDAMRTVGNDVKRRLAQGTPRRTGLTARRIRVDLRHFRGEGIAIIKYRGRSAATIGMREHGTVRQPGRPFFLAAIDGYEEPANRVLTAAVRDSLRAA